VSFAPLQEQFAVIFPKIYHAVRYLPRFIYCYNQYWDSFRWKVVPFFQFLFKGFNIGHFTQWVPQLRPFIDHLEHIPHDMKSSKVLKCCNGKFIIGLYLYLCLHCKDLVFFDSGILFKVNMVACVDTTSIFLCVCSSISDQNTSHIIMQLKVARP
jgi:hypothetical protein